jgi:hypothetical protein
MANYPPPEPTSFTPSNEQLEREQALKRFNRLYIYTPVAIGAAVAIGLLILMLVGIFAPGLVGAEAFLSGLADTILVMWMIPMMVLFAMGPIAYVAYLVNRRQRRNQLPPDSPLLQHSRVEMALWQAQNVLDRVERQTEAVSDRVAQPFVNAGGLKAEVNAWSEILTRPFRSSENDDPDRP